MIRELSTELISAEPTPDQAAQFAEEVHSRLADLPGKLERTIAIRRMQGHSNSEIAEELDVSQRTVERKLNLIRQMWS